MGVRKTDTTLARRIDSVLVRRRGEIQRVLDRYSVPRMAS
jgi:hypothetical protein